MSLICAFTSLLNAQVSINGETEPCPGRVYQYRLDGAICGGVTWEVIDGSIVHVGSQTVNVIWNKEIVNNGRWKLRALYTTMGLGGACGFSTFMDITVAVKTSSAFNIGGDSAIPCGFRGVKNYTALIRNNEFSADAYKWTTNTGWTTTTTSPSVSLNFNNDNIKWLEVVGYKNECGGLRCPYKT